MSSRLTNLLKLFIELRQVELADLKGYRQTWHPILPSSILTLTKFQYVYLFFGCLLLCLCVRYSGILFMCVRLIF